MSTPQIEVLAHYGRFPEPENSLHMHDTFHATKSLRIEHRFFESRRERAGDGCCKCKETQPITLNEDDVQSAIRAFICACRPELAVGWVIDVRARLIGGAASATAWREKRTEPAQPSMVSAAMANEKGETPGVAAVAAGSPAVCENCTWSDNPWSNYPGKVLCMVRGWGTGVHQKPSHTCEHHEPRQENVPDEPRGK